MGIFPLKPPPHVSWRDRRRDWQWPRPPHADPRVPPDYATAPANVTRMYAGAVAHNSELDRLYHESTTPPATPVSPNLVWPAVSGGS